jgi:hypothetical protein
LIEHGVDAVFPETVRQSANPILMGIRIVAVADEDSRGRQEQLYQPECAD